MDVVLKINRLVFLPDKTKIFELRCEIATRALANAHATVYSNETYALVLNFSSYKQLADFYRWASDQQRYREALKTIPLACGNIIEGSEAGTQAVHFTCLLDDRNRPNGPKDIGLHRTDSLPRFINQGCWCNSCNRYHKCKWYHL